MSKEALDSLPPFDLGHRGDADYTQIDKLLAMTPTQRLRRHERWRSLVMRKPAMPNFLEEIVTVLARAQVEFVIVGGVSAILQGAAIVTGDLDLCYRRTPANIARLVAALAPLNPRPRGFAPDLPFFFDERTVQLGSNFTLDIADQDLDLLGVMSGLGGYEDVLAGASDMVVAGFPVKVLTLAQLIVTKQAAGRDKDRQMLPHLQAALARQQAQGQNPS
jgi:predicted nucleotidyltransferase